jgi:hypothetical protein
MISTTLSVAAGIARGPGPDTLAAIARPGNAAALWERSLPHGFGMWLGAVPATRLPVLRMAGAPAELLPELDRAAADLPPGPWRDFLLADILDLAHRFARIVGTRTLRLRLEAIDDDACRRFHVDRVRARLLCTYRGAGTELAHPAPAGQEPKPIERLSPGTVAILRGKLWSVWDASSLLHRSPPFAPKDMTRLLLDLDPDDRDCGCC